MEIHYYQDDEGDKRFLCFGYECYYPEGAMSDMRASFNVVSKAIEWYKKNKDNHEYIDIYDRVEGKEIKLEFYDE